MQKTGTGHNGDETDVFTLTLAGDKNSEVQVHLHLHSQSVHGNSGHHIDQTTLTGMDLHPIVTSANDEPDSADSTSFIVAADAVSPVAESVDVYLDIFHQAGANMVHDAQSFEPAIISVNEQELTTLLDGDAEHMSASSHDLDPSALHALLSDIEAPDSDHSFAPDFNTMDEPIIPLDDNPPPPDDDPNQQGI